MDEPTAKLAIAMQLGDILMLEASGAILEAVRGSHCENLQIDRNSAAARHEWGFRLASSIVKTVEQEASIVSRLIKMRPTDSPAFARLAALHRPWDNLLEHFLTAATLEEADKPRLSKADSRKRARSPSPNSRLSSTLNESSALNFANISKAELGTKFNHHKKLKVSADFYDRKRVFTVSSFCRNLAKTPTTPTVKPLDLQLNSEQVASSAVIVGASIAAECTSCGKSGLMSELSTLSCNHQYCNDCTARFTKASIQANNAFPLLCCRTAFSFSPVVDNVPAPAFDQHGKEEDGILHATASSCAVAVYTPLFPGEKMDGIIETCQSCSGASCTQCQGEMAKQIEDEPVCESGPQMHVDHDSLPAYRRSKKEPVQISREDCQHRSFDRVSTRDGHCEVCCRDDGLYVYIMKCRRCSFTSCKLCYNVRAWE